MNHETSAAIVHLEPHAANTSLFPIVGIGGSTGGLDAFRRLLGSLPGDTGMAFVFIQHLDPNHESILTSLLSQVTPMAVTEVVGDVLVEPNRVYVIPSSSDLALTDGTLSLIQRDDLGASHLPIDAFLTSLSKARGSQAIGVVLSGTGSDGTLGLEAIEARGGIGFAQEPSSAKAIEMPASAIAAGKVDFVLGPEDIAKELARLAEHPYLAPPDAAHSDAAPPDAAPPDAVPPDSGVVDPNVAKSASPFIENKGPRQIDPAALGEILEILKRASGTSFGAYKKTTLRRRIARRMAVVRVDTLEQYARYLESDPKEKSALYDDCLICVTSFFRDPDAFRALEQHCKPLLKGRTVDSPFRVWVPGCATGEEAYSIAMSLIESNGDSEHIPALQIFATDLNERALAKARDGVYPITIANDVPEARLRRFFVKSGDRYRINKLVREMCVFARHDLTRDPPYSHLDLISCRNVLIYLEPSLQEMVLATFHYALRPGGFMFLGSAETATSVDRLFAPLDEHHRLYAKKQTNSAPQLLSAHRETSPTWTVFDQPPRKVTRSSEVLKEADRIILARFGPAAVIVDDNCTVLEFRGDTDPFLDHGHGRATLHLERLLRRGLLLEFREALAEVRKTGATARRGNLHVRNRQQLQRVALEVIPLKGRVEQENCLLVLFATENLGPDLRDPAASATEEGSDKDREIDRLNSGLGRAAEHMHTLIREHETAVAELQATTEEALSNNEELQSLNEELQTAKEEIQSTNEELATLNQELQDRNAQLAQANEEITRALDGANALVDTVPLPLVILDPELRVQTANAAFYDVFRVTPQETVGHALAELGERNWDRPELLSGLNEAMARGKPVKDLVVEGSFPNLGVRAMSLNARRIHTERGGPRRVLLVIEDRTEILGAERGKEALLALEHQARVDAETADHLKDQFVATVSHELRGPLSVIAGWVDILTVDVKDLEVSTMNRALAAIRRGLSAQKRLISELLDHSQFVMGKVVLERSSNDLVAIAQTALVGIRAAAEGKEIDVTFTHDSPQCFVHCDPDRMQQVMWNLLLNALKFTPAKGRVSVSIGRALNQVHFTVTDTGIGISPDFLPHVFERFRQAEGSSTRTQAGLGLGLKLVHDLVELHGGTVQAHSPGLGLGSTFVVVLPVPALQVDDAVQHQADKQYQSNRFPSVPPEFLLSIGRDFLAGTRLLVVDDEYDACEALAGLLERYGAKVTCVNSVALAMDALAGELPDVLISDLAIPQQDGYELIRRVRLMRAEKGVRLPAIAVSAYNKDKHRQRALKAGFQSYLEKPVAPSELMRVVSKLARHDTAVSSMPAL